MDVFDNIDEGADVQKTTDNVGGGSFDPLPTAIYDMKIDAAFLGASASGAYNVTLQLKEPLSQKTIKQVIYISKNTANGGGNTYTKDGKKIMLPGFDNINNLCMLAANMPFSGMKSQLKTRTIKQYDFDAKKEIPKDVQMLEPLIGQSVLVALFEQTVDKKKKVGNTYKATGETKQENEIAAFMRAKDKFTVPELRDKAETPSFYKDWGDQWTGKTRMRLDKDSPAKNGGGGTAGAPTMDTAAAAEEDEMFAMPNAG